MVSVGDDEREYCKTSRVSLDKLCHPTLGLRGNRSVRADPRTPPDKTYNYDWSISTMRNSAEPPNKIYYVEGGWHSCFRFAVEATVPQFQQDLLSIEIRVSVQRHYSNMCVGLIPHSYFSRHTAPKKIFCFTYLSGIAADTRKASHAGWPDPSVPW